MTSPELRAIRATIHLSDLAVLAPADIVAQHCGSYSTLLRLLKDEGTSFRAEVNRERKRRIVELLAEDSHVSGHKMAHACGFANPDNVYRSWPFWFGEKYNVTQGERSKYEPKG